MAVTLKEICRRTGAAELPGAADRMVESLLTDSRSLRGNAANTIFFALHTHTGDGHFYLRSLYDKGVRMFVVERIPEVMRDLPDALMLVVPDTFAALRAAGRSEPGYSGTTIAVCGSRGKTVAKEWLYDALSQLPMPENGSKASVYRSPRSFNSQTGVPLSLWQVKADNDYAVIESGISQRGEMEHLQAMVKPKIAVYTSFDTDTHAAGFDSPQQKAAEKALMAREADTVVYNGDNVLLAQALADAPGKHLWWSRTNPAAPIYINKEEKLDSATRVTLGSGEVYTLAAHTPGEVEDALAVMITLKALGYDSDAIGSLLQRLMPVSARLDVVEGINGCTVAVDGYRADMSSLPEALDFMHRNSARQQRLTLVLSDLCNAGEADYRRLTRLLADGGVDRLIAVGPEMQRNAALLPQKTQVFADVSAMLAALSVDDFSGEFVMVKGTPGDGLESVAEMLAARKHETVLEVNLGAMARNFAACKRRLPEGTRITAMVKAEAYGMGSYEFSRTLQDLGADYLAVAVLDEGLALRRRGITMPVMVMNPKAVNYRSMFANRLEPNIYSMSMLEEVIAAARANGVKHYPVHIKLDTGMHRTGFEQQDLEALCDTLATATEVRAASVFSHLATADCTDMDNYTLAQNDTFRKMTDYMAGRLPYTFLRHILNSAGIVRFPEFAYDMVRLGIGLYGINTLPPEVDNPLEPVARLRTAIISLRSVKPGDAVGYSRAGKVSRPSVIATLPIGYADGFNRRFGCGNLTVKVNGKEAPTIGNICMDQCMIDVTDIPCKVGDTVEIFGPDTPIERLSAALGTIPYEILTSVSPRVKRLYYRE